MERIPKIAKEINRLLLEKGYSSKKPYIPHNPYTLTRVTDMPGVLDFWEGDLESVHPGEETINVTLSNPENPQEKVELSIINYLTHYQQGTIEDFWSTEVLKKLKEEINTQI